MNKAKKLKAAFIFTFPFIAELVLTFVSFRIPQFTQAHCYPILFGVMAILAGNEAETVKLYGVGVCCTYFLRSVFSLKPGFLLSLLLAIPISLGLNALRVIFENPEQPEEFTCNYWLTFAYMTITNLGITFIDHYAPSFFQVFIR